MNHIRPSAFLCLIITIILSCQSSSGISQSPNKDLFNTWTWVESSGGIAGRVANPISSGYTRKITLTADGVFTEFQNDKKIKTANFKIIKGKSIYSNLEKNLLDFEDMMDKSFKFKGDTLYLYDEVHDGFTNIYVKQNK